MPTASLTEVFGQPPRSLSENPVVTSVPCHNHPSGALREARRHLFSRSARSQEDVECPTASLTEVFGQPPRELLEAPMRRAPGLPPNLSLPCPLRRALFRALVVVLSFLPALATETWSASNDDNVEWNLVYSDASLRQPRHPSAGEDFRVELHVARGDISGARVRVWNGSTRRFDMAWVRNEGDLDVWAATVAGVAGDWLYYRFEIVDGSDTDYYNALGMSGSTPSSGDFLVNTTSLGRFPLGSTLDGDGAVLRVWAPNAEFVNVAGTFNDWSASRHPMESVQGFWQVFVPGVRAGDEYKFVIENEGTHWRTDPHAREMTSSVGNSRVVDTSWQWGDGDWQTPFFEDLIVYELHVGTFSGEGDGVPQHPGGFRDAVDQHLDHLVALGINCVELMPVNEFAADISWGYNPSSQFAVESSYGSSRDLKYLIDSCHQAGIAVLVDVVFNHMGATDLAGNLLEFDGEEIYFYPEGNGFRETPWGPRPDYGRVEVRQYLRQSIRTWLEEYHVDGFRLDGTDFVKVNAEGWQLLREVAQTVDTISRKAIVIAEQLPNDPAVTRSLAEGGAGADAQWNDLFHDAVRAALEASAFGDPNLGAVAAGMNHFDFGGFRAVNYIESHDEVAVHGRVARVADGSDPESQFAYGRGKLLWGLTMFTAGIPMVLQGQEWLEDRGFGDTRAERIQWRYQDDHGDFLQATTDMTRLRRILPALRADGGQNVFSVDDSNEVIAWHRFTSSGDDVVIVASFANSDHEGYCIGMPFGGDWFEVLNTDAAVYGGRNRGNGGQAEANGGARHGFGSSACITVPARSVLVFTRQPVDLERTRFARGDCNGDGRLDISDAVLVLRELFQAVLPGDCPAACDADGNGVAQVTDAVFALSFLFGEGAEPPAPWPSCGDGETPLDCERPCP